MHSEDSPAASGGQATYDLLAEMLRAGRAPSIGALLALSPDEPLAEFEPDESQEAGAGSRHRLDACAEKNHEGWPETR